MRARLASMLRALAERLAPQTIAYVKEGDTLHVYPSAASARASQEDPCDDPLCPICRDVARDAQALVENLDKGFTT